MPDDVLILGGGAIGLSLAYELASAGARVRVLEKGLPGQQASWAGAGMLPPASLQAAEPLEQLFALSNQLHAEWASRLRAETGIDNGYRVTGGIYLLAEGEKLAPLGVLHGEPLGADLRRQSLSPSELAAIEPGLAPRSAVLLPDEAQVRNPRHLKALLAALASRAVPVEAQAEVVGFRSSGGRITAVETTKGLYSAKQYCVAAGAWSDRLLAPLGLRLGVHPIRGQIALLTCDTPLLTHNINQGPRYLVPRDDGRVLVGSTEEDAGFDAQNTDEAIADLLDMAYCLAPGLKAARVERTWAGLRPAIVRGTPCLGESPEHENLFIATGHFRNGLQLSTGSARVMSQLIQRQAPHINLAPFAFPTGNERGQAWGSRAEAHAT